MFNRNYLILPLVLLLYLGGCASLGDGTKQTENSAPTLKLNGSLNDDLGIILMSAGRVQEREFQFQRPFLSYGIYSYDGTDYTRKALFLAEPYPYYNQFEKGKYGFVHVRELTPGPYLIRVFKGGSVGSSTYKLDEEIIYKFELKPNVINYIGEFLLTEKIINENSIKISNNFERDIAALTKLLPELSNLEVSMTPLELDSK